MPRIPAAVAHRRATAAIRRQRHTQAGRCSSCLRRQARGLSRCQACLASAAKATAATVARRRNAGLCVRCGRRAPDGISAVHCGSCRAQVNSARAARKLRRR